MKQRLLTTFLAIPLLYYALWIAPPIVFALFVVGAVIFGLKEFYGMAERVEASGSLWIGGVASVLVLVAFWRHEAEYAVLVLVMVVAVAMIAHMVRRRPLNMALRSISTTLAGVVYLGVCMGYLIGVRLVAQETMLSAKLLSFYFMVIWGGDSMAMLVGRRFGRRPLLPVISPKKTVEGGLGGLAGSLLGAIISWVWFFPELRLAQAVSLGLVMGGVAQVGDWCESMLKRGSEIKDASGIIPGHGGVLDRLDSLLFNAPILYYFYQWWMS